MCTTDIQSMQRSPLTLENYLKARDAVLEKLEVAATSGSEMPEGKNEALIDRDERNRIPEYYGCSAFERNVRQAAHTAALPDIDPMSYQLRRERSLPLAVAKQRVIEQTDDFVQQVFRPDGSIDKKWLNAKLTTDSFVQQWPEFQRNLVNAITLKP